MDARKKKYADPAPSHSLREAILQERIKEAEIVDRDTDRRSSEFARLEILLADLERVFDEIPKSDDRFCLALSPSEPARLWIDMLAYVAMDPLARTYRLIWNGGMGRKVLAESENVAEIKTHVMDYVAGQIVARERQIQGLADRHTPAAPKSAARRRGGGVVVWAFIIGVLTGILGLLAIGFLITP